MAPYWPTWLQLVTSRETAFASPSQSETQISKPIFLVRYGWNSDVSRVEPYGDFSSEELPERGARVVVDCGRGIEVAECLGTCSVEIKQSAGQLLRRMSVEDELISGQLQLLAQKAFERCAAWLESTGSSHVLLEVEPLLDGKTLLFHFLSDPDYLLQEQLDQLVMLYEQEVSESEFAKKLETGCGPGCGTAEKSSCGTSTGGCSGCSTGCKTKNAIKSR